MHGPFVIRVQHFNQGDEQWHEDSIFYAETPLELKGKIGIYKGLEHSYQFVILECLYVTGEGQELWRQLDSSKVLSEIADS